MALHLGAGWSPQELGRRLQLSTLIDTFPWSGACGHLAASLESPQLHSHVYTLESHDEPRRKMLQVPHLLLLAFLRLVLLWIPLAGLQEAGRGSEMCFFKAQPDHPTVLRDAHAFLATPAVQRWV